MTFVPRPHGGGVILEAIEGPVSFSEIVEAKAEHAAESVLLHASALGPDFFDLSTRVAGELLQKLANYRIRVAVLDPDLERRSERFRELAGETRRSRSRDLRIVADESEALAFLVG